MDLVNDMLNWVATPAMIASLLLSYPPYYLFKTCYSFLSYLFREDLAGKVVLITGASSGIGEVSKTAHVLSWYIHTTLFVLTKSDVFLLFIYGRTKYTFMIFSATRIKFVIRCCYARRC
jgi:hypothetical protein